MLNKAIKMLRLYHGYSSGQMAVKLEVFASAYSTMEKGNREIPVDIIEKSAKIFGMKASEIMLFSEKLKTKKGLSEEILKQIKRTIQEY